MMDEATEGLSPLIRNEIWQTLKILRAEGLAILVTDKNLQQLLSLCDRHYVIEKGQCVWTGDSPTFLANNALRDKYLAI